MSDGWRQETLGALCTKIGSGATPRGGKSVYTAEGTAFIRSQNVLDHAFTPTGLVFIEMQAAGLLAGVRVMSGDVLVNITGDSVARCCMAPVGLDARVSQHVAIVRVRPEILDPRFLAAFLVSPPVKSRLLQLAGGGATRPALTKAHLQHLSMPVPPIASQQAIADVLSAFSDKIEANRTLVETAEQLAIGQLETSCDRITLKMVADVSQISVAVSDFGSAEVDHFSLPAFDAGRLPERCYGSMIKSAKNRLSAPAVLVSKLNPHIPRVWHVSPEPGVMSLTSTEFVVLVPKPGVSSFELWAACATSSFSAALASRVTGTTGSHQRVRPQDILETPVVDLARVLPTARAATAALVERAAAARVESAHLAEMRDALLPALVAGRLRVKPAGGAKGEAA